jgi:hypothetical protein
MNNIFRYIICTIVLSAFFLNAEGQDSIEFPPPVEMVDTTVYETPASTDYHFKEIDSANKVDVRTIPGSDVKRVKSDDDYWYANVAPPREKKEPESVKKPARIFDKAWLKTLFWILLVGGFIALLVWFLATSNVSLFRKKMKATYENPEEIETENIFELNFEKEIQKAIDAADYRLAVRLMYLRTLRDLSLRNHINYTHEKTNTDYLLQLAGSPYYKNFFRLTRNFDYTWYGHFLLTQESFTLIQNDFNSFKQQLS